MGAGCRRWVIPCFFLAAPYDLCFSHLAGTACPATSDSPLTEENAHTTSDERKMTSPCLFWAHMVLLPSNRVAKADEKVRCSFCEHPVRYGPESRESFSLEKTQRSNYSRHSLLLVPKFQKRAKAVSIAGNTRLGHTTPQQETRMLTL